MFVRVHREGHVDSVFECDIVHVRPLEGSDSMRDHFLMEMEREGRQSVLVQVDKGVDAVYLMNDQGRTIDVICRKD